MGRLFDLFERHDILGCASAIAFQTLFALVPLGLFVLALLGFVELDRAWDDAAAEIEPQVSAAAFEVIDDTARTVLDDQRPFWLTVGAALAMWRLSAAVRATMSALDRIYGDGEDRPLGERVRTSVALSLATTVLVLAALAVLYLGPVVVPTEAPVSDLVSFVVRWALALALAVLAAGLLVHYAPAHPRPLGWVSRGTLLAAVCWLLATLAFAFYVTELADYGSVFGSFATIFLLLTYLYLSATAFLLGVEIDVRARNGAAETATGPARAAPVVASNR